MGSLIKSRSTGYAGRLSGHRSRRGAIAVIAVVCVVIVTMIAISTMVLSTRYRRQSRNELAVQQADWILDAGVRFGVSQLRENPKYEGETIQVETGLPFLDVGSVKIETVLDTETDKVKLGVAVELTRNADAGPDGSSRTGISNHRRIRRSAEILVTAEQ